VSLIVQRPQQRVEAEPAVGQKMQHVCAQRGALRVIGSGEQFADPGPRTRHLEHKLPQNACLHASFAVTVQQPDVVQQRPAKQFLFGHQVEGPALLLGEQSAHRQLALDDGPIEAAAELDFDQPLAAVGHFHQEVRHDVGYAGVLLPLARLGRRVVEEFSLDLILHTLLGVPDAQGLLLDVNHPGARHEDHGRRSLKLSLAADRPALFRTGHQEERTRRLPPQPESGQPAGFKRVGHGKPFSWVNGQPWSRGLTSSPW